MARRHNRVNIEWQTPDLGWSWDHVQIEVLMDIRAELRRLNTLLHCPNFVSIPTTLRGIARKMPAKKAAKRV